MDDFLNDRAKQFVIQAAISALICVELCFIASEKASSGATKDLARSALDTHCEIANAVVDTALCYGVTIPADFDEDHKNNVRLLLSAQGEKFDRSFVQVLIAEDEAAFFFHAGEAIQGSAGLPIEAIASRAMPLLQEELSILRSIFPAEAP